jgi:CrcB protein
MLRILLIAAGGSIGALFRYYLSGIPYRYMGENFPYGTLLVNLTGAFLIGLLWGVTEEAVISPYIKSFVFIGVIASFTTFSTFALESALLIRDGEYAMSMAYILITNLGILLVFAGLFSSRYISGGVA